MRWLLLIALATAGAAQDFPSLVEFTQSLDSVLPAGYAGSSVTSRDLTGGFFLAGSASVPLPGTPNVVTSGTLANYDLYVVRFDTLSNTVSAVTVIGGSGNDQLLAMKADPSGNVYLLGFTDSADFPERPPEAKPTATYFIAKLLPGGQKLAYTRFLGTNIRPTHLDIDASGSIFLAGTAGVRDLPTSPGVLRPSPILDVNPSDQQPFVGKWNASADQLLWATFLPLPLEDVRRFALRPSGDLLVIGRSSLTVINSSGTDVVLTRPLTLVDPSLDFDAQGNLYLAGPEANGSGQWNARIQKYAPDGTLLLSQVLGPAAGPVQLVAGSSGRIQVFVGGPAANFPTLNSTQMCAGGGAAILILAPDGRVLHSTYSATSLQNPRQLSTGIYAVSFRGVSRVNADLIPPDRLSPACLVHGATFNATELSPGLIATIFGSHLGPVTGVAAVPSGQRMPFELAGLSVTVGGLPAPLLYVQEGQINFITPWSAPPRQQVFLCVKSATEERCSLTRIEPSAPGFFTYLESSAALNQDFSVNTPENPAARGSVVAFFLTGTPPPSSALEDGAIAGLDLQPTPGTILAGFTDDFHPCPPPGGCNPVKSFPAEVLYSGSAPTLVLGGSQLNLRIPADAPWTGKRSFTVRFGLGGSPISGTVYVK